MPIYSTSFSGPSSINIFCARQLGDTVDTSSLFRKVAERSSTRAVETVGAGELAALVGLKRTRSGDTLIAATGRHRLDGAFRLPGIDIPDPVFFQAIEPGGASLEVGIRASEPFV